MQRHAPAVARHQVPRADQPVHFHLQPLDRRIDVADRGAPAGLLAEHVPRLERLAQLQVHAGRRHRARERESEFLVRREPVRPHVVAGGAKVVEHAGKVFRDEMRQHEAVVQLGAPAHERRRRYGSFQKRATSARSSSCCVRLMRACGGISNARSSSSPAAAVAVGRIQLVDAELGAMRVAGHVDQQVAEHAIHQPRRPGFARRESA